MERRYRGTVKEMRGISGKKEQSEGKQVLDTTSGRALWPRASCLDFILS